MELFKTCLYETNYIKHIKNQVRPEYDILRNIYNSVNRLIIISLFASIPRLNEHQDLTSAFSFFTFEASSTKLIF